MGHGSFFLPLLPFLWVEPYKYKVSVHFWHFLRVREVPHLAPLIDYPQVSPLPYLWHLLQVSH